jgi:sister-chromatid-cohesion protein PDS5
MQKGDGNKKNREQSLAHHAQTILSYTSKHCPALYKPHVGELAKAIADEKNPILVETSLQALAAVVKWDDQLAPHDK